MDESFGPDIAVVGGLLIPTDRLSDVESGWRGLKVSLGLDAGAELKYNISSGSSARRELEAAGNTVRVRQPEILRYIAASGATLLSSVVHTPGDEATPEKYYLDGFRWALQRFANHVEFDLGCPPGPHTVLADMPPSPPRVGPADSPHVRALFADPACAQQALYREAVLRGISYPSRRSRPFAELGFSGSMSTAKSAYSDILQMADFVVGCVRDFVGHALRPSRLVGIVSEPSYRDDLLAIIGPAFRRAPGGSARDRGFGVHPLRDLQTLAAGAAAVAILDGVPRERAA